MMGMGRIFSEGSGIGGETSMIAANDRRNVVIRRRLTSSKETMADEYGEMTSDGESYTHPTPFQLESGDVLPEAILKYQTYGNLNDERDNVIVICHALTGNASLHTWWGGLLGPSLPFDTNKYYIICANILGSCYGSTSPVSINRQTNKIYGNDFPDVTVRDTVGLQLHLLRSLNIKSVKSVIGGSFGGMQAVEYAAMAGIGDDPYVRSVIPIACGSRHTAWQIGISEVQRQAIYADPKWNNGNVDFNDLPLAGLSVARMLGMVSYRTSLGYDKKFGRRVNENGAWEVRNYLEYQGNKFLKRFDPVTYVKLTEQMDTHDIGRNREGEKAALENCKIPALVLGIDSDVLYPLREQEELVDLFKKGQMEIIHSDAGHDGFLLEQDQVGNRITQFLEQNP
eukprot:CAMPEP_0172512526 /NCGR_PEP_ID=MMETSP1066-20121228/245447_1 /TAXON_ID=671091 /ORGANISM="Coscinodiscus wailesii, Strain CCMP2513" /LENGTH=396 /DNA_ID=CAMNT_0013292399 /DNA_START=191 /DNA_END=1381 /DNA_ORIENTATION=+